MPYVSHTTRDQEEMLSALGLNRMEDLFRSVPPGVRLDRPLAIPAAKTEDEVLREFQSLADQNARMDTRPSFLGAGVYRRFIPAAIDALSSRGEFNTAYTPYQAEVSQGTLQAIMEYQTMVAELTGMAISNASLYDGATALVEAVLMSYAVRSEGSVVILSEGVHPEYRRVLETYLRRHPVRIREIPLADGVTHARSVDEALREEGSDALAVVLAQPNFLGFLEDAEGVAGALRARGDYERPFLIALVDPISLAIVAPPGSYEADIAVGDGQQLGNPPSLGGPSFGFFATLERHVRKVPGRIVGETKDRDGRRGYVLTFQTREQHIRRARATSNICTNQGLCSLRAAMYLALLGREGLREVAEVSTRRAHHAFRLLTALPGIEPVSTAPFFQEFPLRLPFSADAVYRRLGGLGVGGGLPLGRYYADREREMLFACTEMTTAADIDCLVSAMAQLVADRETERGR